MIKLLKILVPTDFSSHSNKAVQYGIEFASRFGAELHLLHAVEQVPILYGEGSGVPPESTAELVAAATKELDAVLPDRTSNTQILRKVIHGSPFVEIIRYAEENGVDLIILGSHGRSAVARVLMGSVAEKVVRKSPCPVMTLRDDTHDFVMT